MDKFTGRAVGDQVAFGDELSENQLQAIRSAAPTANEILEGMDNLNEELGDTTELEEAKSLPETAVPTPVSSGRKRRQNKKSTMNEETKMNLDKELDDFDKELDDRTTGQEEAQEQEYPEMKDQILNLLKNKENAPNEQAIAAWKARYGNNAVHVMAFSEDDIYVFTHLQTGQWKKIQEVVAKAQEAGERDVEEALKEKVVQYCTLWPNLPVDFYYTSKAGVVDSLYQVILLNSYFLTPQQAMLLTTQL